MPKLSQYTTITSVAAPTTTFIPVIENGVNKKVAVDKLFLNPTFTGQVNVPASDYATAAAQMGVLNDRVPRPTNPNMILKSNDDGTASWSQTLSKEVTGDYNILPSDNGLLIYANCATAITFRILAANNTFPIGFTVNLYPYSNVPVVNTAGFFSAHWAITPGLADEGNFINYNAITKVIKVSETLWLVDGVIKPL